MLPNIIRSTDDLNHLVKILTAHREFAYDFETTGTDIRTLAVVGMAFAFAPIDGDIQCCYIPLAHRTPDGIPGDFQNAEFSQEEFAHLIAPLFEDTEKTAIAWNAKFDERILEDVLWITVRCQLWDGMIADHLEWPGRGHGLKMCTKRYFGKDQTAYDAVVPKGKTIADVAVGVVAHYANQDTTFTLQHAQRQRGVLEELRLTKLAQEVSMPLVRVIKNMERIGVRIDVPFLEGLRNETLQELEVLHHQMNTLVGRPVNMNPSTSLNEALFVTLKAPVAGIDKNSRGYSTDAENLHKLADGGFAPASIVLRYRELAKLEGTYQSGLLHRAKQSPGCRVYAEFLQHGTQTGRWSSKNPNLQNIPARGEDGQKIRKAFIPSPGWVWVKADFSQSQLRLTAHFAQDPAMMQVFLEGGDIHQTTIDAISLLVGRRISRGHAKSINFSLIFGKWWGNLANDLGVSVEEAKQFYDAFFGKYQNVRPYIERVQQEITQTGAVTTLLNRRRYFPEIKLKGLSFAKKSHILRQGVNTKIQGSDAELMMVSQRNIQRITDGGLSDRIHQLIQVHDEVNLEIREDFLEEGCSLVQKAMEGSVGLRVPLVVTPATGANWGDCK